MKYEIYYSTPNYRLYKGEELIMENPDKKVIEAEKARLEKNG